MMKPRILMLVAIIGSLLSSCANVRSGIDQGLVPDGTTSIVVGRSQLILNGVPITPGMVSGMISPVIMSHINPFVGVDQVTRNSYAPGKWAIKVRMSEDGYFATNLPPGQYYFVEYIFTGVEGRTVGFRSYMPILGGEVYKPTITTFDVLPGKATYIGTMQHNLSAMQSPSGKKWTSPSGKWWSWGMRITDESSLTQEWLWERYPRWSQYLSTKLAVTKSIE